MRSLNRVTLLGNVGKDPETQDVKGTLKASFSLATTKKWKDRDGQEKEDTQWHALDIWGKGAEILSKYVKKGTRLYVEGELKTDSWEDNGVRKFKTYILVRDFSMMSPPQGQASSQPVNATPIPPSQFDEQEDDLPF